MSGGAGARAWMVEVTVAQGREVLFQALLQGEDGLAVDRCFDPARRVQQLWTTASQLPALRAWLASLPEALELRVLGESALEPAQGNDRSA